MTLEATFTETESQNVLLNENTQNTVSDIFSTYVISMSSFSVSNQSQISHSRRQHQNQQSAEKIEIKIHTQHMQNMYQKIKAL